MDIFSTFHENHAAVIGSLEHLHDYSFEEFEKRREFFKRIKCYLLSCVKYEESVFYQMLKTKGEENKKIIDAFTDHHIMSMMMQEMEDTFQDNYLWNKSLSRLENMFKKHVSREDAILSEAAIDKTTKKEREILWMPQSRALWELCRPEIHDSAA